MSSRSGDRLFSSWGRSRVSIALIFLSFGLVIGAWTSRLPAVKAHAALSDHELSVALVALAAGCVTGMAVLARQLDRVAVGGRVGRRAGPVVPLAILLAALLPVAAGQASLLSLCVSLVALGAAQGTLNVAMNARATRLEAVVGRPILSSFHAVFSIGGLLGAGIGAATAAASLSALATFSGVGALVVVLACLSTVLGADLPRPSASDTSRPHDGRRGAPAPIVVFLGVIVLIAMVGEGAAGDWAAVYLDNNRHASPALSAAGFVAFSAAMLVGRLAGDRLVDRFRPVACVRIGAAIAALGLSLGLVSPGPLGAIAGFAAFGLGLSPITPQVYSAIGRRSPAAAARELSVVVGLGYTGFLIGPTVIGFLSAVAGLRMALAVPAILLIVVSLGAGSLARAIPRPLGSEQKA